MLNSIQSDLIRGHINTIILKSLFEGDRYGYDIVKEIEQKSGGQYKLKQPTLYSCLKRLEVQGYIRSYWGTKSNGGRRKYFTLTEEGKELYQKSQTEWEYSRTIIDKLISDKAFDLQNMNEGLENANNEDVEAIFQNEEINYNDEIEENISHDKNYIDEKISEKIDFLDTAQIMEQLFDQNQSEGYFENIKHQKIKVEAQELQASSNNYFQDFTEDSLEQSPEEAYYDMINNDNQPNLDVAFQNFNKELDNLSPVQENINNSINDEGFLSYDTSKSAIDERKIILEREYKNVLSGLLKPSELKQNESSNETLVATSAFESVGHLSPMSAMANEIQFKDNTFEVDEAQKEPQDGLTKDKHANKKLDKLALSVKEMGDNFKIRSHNNRASREYSSTYYYFSNKLMLAHYGILFGIMLLEIIFCFLFIRIGIQKAQKFDLIMYLLSVILAVAFPITAFFMNVMDANKRKRINFDLKNSLVFRFILMGLLWLITYCVNIYLKMPLTFSADYMNSLILPALLSTSFPVSAVIFNVLYKSKKYSVEN